MSSPVRVTLLTISLCFAVLVFVTHFAAPASAEGITATEWKLLADDGKGGEGEEVESFLPSDHKIHFRAAIEGDVPAGTKFKWVFTSVDTAGGKNVKITETETTAEKAGATSVSCTVSLPKDWPVGDYRVDLSVNGKPVGSYDYSVEKEEEGDKDNE